MSMGHHPRVSRSLGTNFNTHPCLVLESPRKPPQAVPTSLLYDQPSGMHHHPTWTLSPAYLHPTCTFHSAQWPSSWVQEAGSVFTLRKPRSLQSGFCSVHQASGPCPGFLLSVCLTNSCLSCKAQLNKDKHLKAHQKGTE